MLLEIHLILRSDIVVCGLNQTLVNELVVQLVSLLITQDIRIVSFQVPLGQLNLVLPLQLFLRGIHRLIKRLIQLPLVQLVYLYQASIFQLDLLLLLKVVMDGFGNLLEVRFSVPIELEKLA